MKDALIRWSGCAPTVATTLGTVRAFARIAPSYEEAVAKMRYPPGADLIFAEMLRGVWGDPPKQICGLLQTTWWDISSKDNETYQFRC